MCQYCEAGCPLCCDWCGAYLCEDAEPGDDQHGTEYADEVLCGDCLTFALIEAEERGDEPE